MSFPVIRSSSHTNFTSVLVNCNIPIDLDDSLWRSNPYTSMHWERFRAKEIQNKWVMHFMKIVIIYSRQFLL
ncbi:hypothetical protein I3843_16G089200 [Carya illinoinensis]|nr:hypothetical protein I3843_16G089200 [Carya illinoinensis]